MALSEMLAELEQAASAEKKATYRTLSGGLWLRVTPGAEPDSMVCAIARPAPSMPSADEEKTVAQALAPAFVSNWARRSGVPGPGNKRFNVSSVTYTRTF